MGILMLPWAAAAKRYSAQPISTRIDIGQVFCQPDCRLEANVQILNDSETTIYDVRIVPAVSSAGSEPDTWRLITPEESLAIAEIGPGGRIDIKFEVELDKEGRYRVGAGVLTATSFFPPTGEVVWVRATSTWVATFLKVLAVLTFTAYLLIKLGLNTSLSRFLPVIGLLAVSGALLVSGNLAADPTIVLTVYAVVWIIGFVLLQVGQQGYRGKFPYMFAVALVSWLAIGIVFTQFYGVGVRGISPEDAGRTLTLPFLLQWPILLSQSLGIAPIELSPA